MLARKLLAIYMKLEMLRYVKMDYDVGAVSILIILGGLTLLYFQRKIK